MEEINVAKEVYDSYQNKLKSRLFGILRERERGREWKKFLDSVLIELYGYSDEQKTINYYALCSKLSACRFLDYEYFRTTIFDCMNLVDRI